MTRIAVASRSFARNATLRAELLAQYSTVTFIESPTALSGAALVDLLRGPERAIVGLERIDGPLLAQLPELRIISKYGVGLDGLDLDAIARAGVKLAWTGGDICDYPDFYAASGVEPVSRERLLAESEIVTLHVPLDASTRGMIGAAELARMQRGAFLINAARGGLVNEPALLEALSTGHLAGAAFDVFELEPEANPALLALPTFLATPHIGGSTAEAQLAMGRAAIAGLEQARDVADGWPR